MLLTNGCSNLMSAPDDIVRYTQDFLVTRDVLTRYVKCPEPPLSQSPDYEFLKQLLYNFLFVVFFQIVNVCTTYQFLYLYDVLNTVYLIQHLRLQSYQLRTLNNISLSSSQ